MKTDLDIAFCVAPSDGHCAVTFYKDGTLDCVYSSTHTNTYNWWVTGEYIKLGNKLEPNDAQHMAKHFQLAYQQYLADCILLDIDPDPNNHHKK